MVFLLKTGRRTGRGTYREMQQGGINGKRRHRIKEEKSNINMVKRGITVRGIILKTKTPGQQMEKREGERRQLRRERGYRKEKPDRIGVRNWLGDRRRSIRTEGY